MIQQEKREQRLRELLVLAVVAALAAAGLCLGESGPAARGAFTPEQLLGMRCLQENLYALVFFVLCTLCAFGTGAAAAILRDVLGQRLQYQMRVLAFLVLDAGIWVLTDSELLKLVTDNTQKVAFVSLLSFGLLAPLTLEFVRCALNRACRWVPWLQCATLALLAADVLGWLFAGKTMFWLVYAIHGTIGLAALLSLYATWNEYRSGRSRELQDILLGFLVLVVFACAAIAALYWDQTSRLYAVLYCIGVLIFLAFLGGAAVRRLRKNLENWMQAATYKTLAYRDGLTGLKNYTAYKQAKERWADRTDWTCVMLDVNWLKQTNDRCGHAAGDALLCGAARCIQEAFFEADGCYRIGGDEFAVLWCGAQQREVEAAVQDLRRLCAGWNQTAQVPVSLAVGYAMQAGRTLTADELRAQADAAMYANKAEIKKKAGKS